MKVEHYNMAVRAGLTRRRLLQTAASMGALGAMGVTAPALAGGHGNVRAQILQIPGVGKGSPTDADWQKVGQLCLEATKANVAQGEFAGVELTFMGLNNQNLHNFLFRGFLKPWEAYTGAKINWIFGKGFVFRNDIYYQKYQGVNDSFDTNYVLWNMSVAKKFMKNDMAEIELSVFDLLGQNQSFSQTINPGYIEEVRTQVLQQYFMLTMSYQLRRFASSK